MIEPKIEMGIQKTPEEQDTWESHEKKNENMEKNVSVDDKEEYVNDVEALYDDLDGASIEHGHVLYQEFFSKWDKRVDLS